MHSTLQAIEKALACYKSLHGVVALLKDPTAKELTLLGEGAQNEAHDLLLAEVYQITPSFALRIQVALDEYAGQAKPKIAPTVVYAIYQHAVAIVTFNFEPPDYMPCIVATDPGRVNRFFHEELRALFAIDQEFRLDLAQAEAKLRQTIHLLLKHHTP